MYYLLTFDNTHGSLSVVKTILFILGFILCMSSSMLIQNKVINLEKEIYEYKITSNKKTIWKQTNLT